MKRLIYLLIIGFLVAACDVETSDNGKLDGFWQLCQLDTLSTGGETDMRESNIYWSVGFELLEIRDMKDFYHAILFRFCLEDGVLTIHSPYYNHRSVGDIRIDDPQLLHDFGIWDLEEHFKVETLSKNEMVLRNAHFRFHLRKY